jgi:hypothetical protein
MYVSMSVSPTKKYTQSNHWQPNHWQPNHWKKSHSGPWRKGAVSQLRNELRAADPAWLVYIVVKAIFGPRMGRDRGTFYRQSSII